MDPSRIVDMASAFYESAALFAASDLGVFAKLAELGPADLDTVISSCGLDRRGGRILLDACAALCLLIAVAFSVWGRTLATRKESTS